jgi:hypothetical protein
MEKRLKWPFPGDGCGREGQTKLLIFHPWLTLKLVEPPPTLHGTVRRDTARRVVESEKFILGGKAPIETKSPFPGDGHGREG